MVAETIDADQYQESRSRATFFLENKFFLPRLILKAIFNSSN